MKHVVTLASFVSAVRGGQLRPRTSVCARALTTAILIAALLTHASAWPGQVFADGWSTDAPSTPDTEGDDPDVEATESPEPTVEPATDESEPWDVPTEEPTEIPTAAPEPTEDPTPEPTLVPMPALTLTTTTECLADGSYASLLSLVVVGAPATITDVFAVDEFGTMMPVRLSVELPVTLFPDTAIWQWWLEPTESYPVLISPVSLLVRVDELAGDELANQLFGDGASGWLLAPLALPVPDCSLPTPVIDLPTEESGNGSAAGSGGEPTATAAPDSGPVLPELTPEPTETQESTPEPTPVVTETPTTEAATSTPESLPDVTETPSPPAEPTPETTSTPPAEATPTETATAKPEEPAAPNPIEVEAQSADRAVQPGDTARYRFRVTNTTDHAIVIRLETIDSVEGWTSRVFAYNGKTDLPETLRLEPGESIDVVVRVYPPVDVRAGQENSTRLRAIPLESPGDDGDNN